MENTTDVALSHDKTKEDSIEQKRPVKLETGTLKPDLTAALKNTTINEAVNLLGVIPKF